MTPPARTPDRTTDLAAGPAPRAPAPAAGPDLRASHAASVPAPSARPLPPGEVLRLQRVLGNRATGRVLAGTLQRTDYRDPTDVAISALMSAAGITDFGPYVWDDTVPRFKLGAGPFAWSFADCLTGPRYEPETNAVVGEKGKNPKKSMIDARVKEARRALFGVTMGVIDKLVAVNNGASPRPFVSVAAEDALGLGAHIEERHVLGQGRMPTRREVALRAAFQKVGATPMPLDPAGVSSVFASRAGANTDVGGAVTGELTNQWAVHRASLIKGNDVKLTVALTGGAAAYQKRDAPAGTAYLDADFPKYIDNAKAGLRELYRGDYAGAGAPVDVNAPTLALDPLTNDVSGTMANVYLIIKADAAAPGGWYVHTAFPKT